MYFLLNNESWIWLFWCNTVKKPCIFPLCYSWVLSFYLQISLFFFFFYGCGFFFCFCFPGMACRCIVWFIFNFSPAFSKGIRISQALLPPPTVLISNGSASDQLHIMLWLNKQTKVQILILAIYLISLITDTACGFCCSPSGVRNKEAVWIFALLKTFEWKWKKIVIFYTEFPILKIVYSISFLVKDPPHYTIFESEGGHQAHGCITWEISLGSLGFCKGIGKTFEGGNIKPFQVGLLADVFQSLKFFWFILNAIRDMGFQVLLQWTPCQWNVQKYFCWAENQLLANCKKWFSAVFRELFVVFRGSWAPEKIKSFSSQNFLLTNNILKENNFL